jgi:hypothetical protein
VTRPFLGFGIHLLTILLVFEHDGYKLSVLEKTAGGKGNNRSVFGPEYNTTHADAFCSTGAGCLGILT